MYNMESHNTVLVYGEPIQPDCIYASKWGVIRPDTPVADFASEEGGCYVKAYHNAYTHSRHVRKILSYRKKGFLIRDEVIGGNRLQKEHIQRWHLFPDVKYEQIDDRSLLLEKNGAKALLLWCGKPTLRIWQKEELNPLIVADKKDIATVIDANFMDEAFSPAGGLEVVAQELLILDVTEGTPRIENVDEFCRLLMKDAEENRLTEALERFSQLS